MKIIYPKTKNQPYTPKTEKPSQETISKLYTEDTTGGREREEKERGRQVVPTAEDEAVEKNES